MPSTTPEIVEEDDWDDEEDTSSILEKVSRGPPGGGTLVRAPPQEDTLSRDKPKRGPPGGGRLIRDEESSILDLDRSPKQDTASPKVDVLKPVSRPVLQPKTGEAATLRPVQTSGKVLTPSEVAKLTPVTPTLTPVESEEQEEE